MAGMMDEVIARFDFLLRTLSGTIEAARPCPGDGSPERLQDSLAKQHVAGLMRVNYAGEVAAQALYLGEATFAREQTVRVHLQRAGGDEADHLAWCATRLKEVDGRLSLFNPLWFAGAFTIGATVSLLGDRPNLCFLAETEDQVVTHLGRHLRKIPYEDEKTAKVLHMMQLDEWRHAEDARHLGAERPPLWVRSGMYFASKIMTWTSYWM
jgi:ubiquinone biosynthesis monooxygenase Coq7